MGLLALFSRGLSTCCHHGELASMFSIQLCIMRFWTISFWCPETRELGHGRSHPYCVQPWQWLATCLHVQDLGEIVYKSVRGYREFSFQKIPIWFPVPTLSGSQLQVSPTAGESVILSGLCEHPHVTYTHTYTQIKEKLKSVTEVGTRTHLLPLTVVLSANMRPERGSSRLSGLCAPSLVTPFGRCL